MVRTQRKWWLSMAITNWRILTVNLWQIIFISFWEVRTCMYQRVPFMRSANPLYQRTSKMIYVKRTDGQHTFISNFQTSCRIILLHVPRLYVIYGCRFIQSSYENSMGTFCATLVIFKATHPLLPEVGWSFRLFTVTGSQRSE